MPRNCLVLALFFIHGVTADTGWVLSDTNDTCGSTCAKTERVCSGTEGATLITNELVGAAFDQAGYTCLSYHVSKDYAGTPFSTGRTNDDCSAYLASRSKIPSCTDNIYPHHKALCYCKDESAGAWFHGDATVLLESGLPKRFSELSLGDRIRTSDGQGSFSFSPVLTLPHANNSEPAVFLTLTTETGKKVDLTSDRLVPKCDRSEITAGGLMVGDCVFTVDGKETLLEISLTAKKGTFTATTQDKFIVVNGVVALSYPTKPELELKLEEITLFEKRDHKLPRPRASGHKKRLRLRAYEQNPL